MTLSHRVGRPLCSGVHHCIGEDEFELTIAVKGFRFDEQPACDSRPIRRFLVKVSQRGIVRKLSTETGATARFLPVTIDSFEILMFVQE
jgi:hypothetical protein